MSGLEGRRGKVAIVGCDSGSGIGGSIHIEAGEWVEKQGKSHIIRMFDPKLRVETEAFRGPNLKNNTVIVRSPVSSWSNVMSWGKTAKKSSNRGTSTHCWFQSECGILEAFLLLVSRSNY